MAEIVKVRPTEFVKLYELPAEYFLKTEDFDLYTEENEVLVWLREQGNVWFEKYKCSFFDECIPGPVGVKQPLIGKSVYLSMRAILMSNEMGYKVDSPESIELTLKEKKIIINKFTEHRKSIDNQIQEEKEAQAGEIQAIKDRKSKLYDQVKSGNFEGWLSSIDLANYVPLFENNSIDGDVIFDISTDDLKEIGIDTVGHRIKLLKSLKVLDKNREDLNDANESSNEPIGDVILSTGDIKQEYEIVRICWGFAKSRSYLEYFDSEALEMLKGFAKTNGCDAVINLRFVMMEGEPESSAPSSIGDAIFSAATEVVAERMVFQSQIPKDGVIVYGTGVKII
jgi:hypothetical protein